MRGLRIELTYVGGVCEEVGEKPRGMGDLGEWKTMRLH